MNRRFSESEKAEPRQLLRVDWDWGSTGIWVLQRPGQKNAGANLADYSDLDLPIWLVRRFRYWTDWQEASESWNFHATADETSLHAYGLSLAVDLKRVLGAAYHIEWRGREVVDDRGRLRRINFPGDPPPEDLL